MSDLAILLDEIGRTADLPFEQATTLPSGAYNDPAFTKLETRKLFAADWICAGRTDEIPEPGDYLTHRIVETPVIVVRQADGSIKALVNACRHRSAGLLSGTGHVAKSLAPGDAEALAAMKAGIATTFDTINMEDRTIVESIARSLKSPHAARGRLGEKERTLWEFWRYLAKTVGAPAPADSIAAQ